MAGGVERHGWPKCHLQIIANDLRHKEASCPFCHSPGVSQAKPGQACWTGCHCHQVDGCLWHMETVTQAGPERQSRPPRRKVIILVLSLQREATGSQGWPQAGGVFAAASERNSSLPQTPMNPPHTIQTTAKRWDNNWQGAGTRMEDRYTLNKTPWWKEGLFQYFSPFKERDGC